MRPSRHQPYGTHRYGPMGPIDTHCPMRPSRHQPFGTHRYGPMGPIESTMGPIDTALWDPQASPALWDRCPQRYRVSQHPSGPMGTTLWGQSPILTCGVNSMGSTLWGQPPPNQPYGVTPMGSATSQPTLWGQPYRVSHQPINPLGSTLWGQPPPNQVYGVNHHPTKPYGFDPMGSTTTLPTLWDQPPPHQPYGVNHHPTNPTGSTTTNRAL